MRELEVAAPTDPIALAEWSLVRFLKPASDEAMTYPAKVTRRWGTSDEARIRYWHECTLLVAAGLAASVAKAATFEFYSAYMHALSGRLVRLQNGHYSAAFVAAARNSIEWYVALLGTAQPIYAAEHFLKHVYGADDSRVDRMLASDLWTAPIEAAERSCHAMREALALSRAPA